jgi:hypothetical protein
MSQHRPLLSCSKSDHVCFTMTLTHYRRIDPTLEPNIQSQDNTSVLSPLISTMPHLHHTRVPNSELPAFETFPPATSISDVVSQLDVRGDTVTELMKIQTAAERRVLFSNQDRRLETTFGPDVSSELLHACRTRMTRMHLIRTSFLLISAMVIYRCTLNPPFTSHMAQLLVSKGTGGLDVQSTSSAVEENWIQRPENTLGRRSSGVSPSN